MTASQLYSASHTAKDLGASLAFSFDELFTAFDGGAMHAQHRSGADLRSAAGLPAGSWGGEIGHPNPIRFATFYRRRRLAARQAGRPGGRLRTRRSALPHRRQEMVDDPGWLYRTYEDNRS